MPPTRHVLRAGIYIISGLAVAYVLKEWIYHLWDVPSDDEQSDAVPPLDTDEDTRPPSTKSLPPLHIPPPGSDLQAPFVSSSLTTQPVFGTREDAEEEDATQSSSSADDSLVDVLSPHPPRVVSKRRSMRAHDLFAESHISFSELGSLVASQNEP